MEINDVLISTSFHTELIRFVEAGNLVPDVRCDHVTLLEEFKDPLNIPALDILVGDYVGQDKRIWEVNQ